MDPQNYKERQEFFSQAQNHGLPQFKNQVLPVWTPFNSILSVIFLAVFGLLFLGLGIPIYVLSNQIKEVVVANYDDMENCKLGMECLIPIIVTEKIPAPVYVFYQLDKYYETHREIVKSRDLNQLQGNYGYQGGQMNVCDPIVRNRDLLPEIDRYVNGEKFGSWDLSVLPAVPCGQVAKDFFNDNYQFSTAKDQIIPINETGIAWQSDIGTRFKNVPDNSDVYGVKKNWTQIQWIDMTNEHFIVWMRTAGLPNPRKIYGKINQDIEPGSYKVRIQNNYDVNRFDGNKSFVLTNTNSLGKKDFFLGVSYITVGAICIIFSVVSLVSFIKKKDNIRQD